MFKSSNITTTTSDSNSDKDKTRNNNTIFKTTKDDKTRLNGGVICNSRSMTPIASPRNNPSINNSNKSTSTASSSSLSFKTNNDERNNKSMNYRNNSSNNNSQNVSTNRSSSNSFYDSTRSNTSIKALDQHQQHQLSKRTSSIWKNTMDITQQLQQQRKTLYNSSLFKFPIMIIDEEYVIDRYDNSGIQSISNAIENEGWEVVHTNNYKELMFFAQEQSRAAAFIVRIKNNTDNDHNANHCELQEFISCVRSRNTNVPIYIYLDSMGHDNIRLSKDITKHIKGIIFQSEDTPDAVARTIVRDASKYLENCKPSFFEALLEYAEDSSYSWHCPGHSGGVAFLKSPVGQMFHQYFGENMLRADVCNAVEELGQLLDHNGSIGESEKEAGRIFGSDYCFFVTNGGSMSNRVVWHHNVANDDLVLIDRNCHVSIIHCLIMTGAIPIFIKGGHGNYLGMSSPILKEQFNKENIQKRINNHPLVKEPKTPRLMMLTQSTQDGLLYNIHDIKNSVDGYIDNLHFDETWVPHAAFHSFYSNYHSMDLQRQHTTQSTMIYTTQAIHKVLAATSQASYILVRDSKTTELDTELFNESYLMHCSTSPQYSIIASCDVTAAMMEPPQGTALVEQSINEAIQFRRAMHKLHQEYQNDDDTWWFQLWEPCFKDDMSSDEWILQQSSSSSSLSANASKPQSYSPPWHGHSNVSPNFHLLDPIKVTILSPGLSQQSGFLPHGIPAIVLTKYLSEHGINVETTGFYSIILLFTIGMTKGRWNTIISTLQQFKQDYDTNRPLWRIMPKTLQKNSSSSQQHVTLKDICKTLHEYYTKNSIIQNLNNLKMHYPKPALKPSKAFEQIARRNTERVKISAATLIGRIAVSTIISYPPGIPIIIPGEMFDGYVVTFLEIILNMRKVCPGFECAIDGIGYENGIFFVDCVKDKGKVR